MFFLNNIKHKFSSSRKTLDSFKELGNRNFGTTVLEMAVKSKANGNNKNTLNKLR